MKIEPSITKLIRHRTSQNLRRIFKSYKKTSRSKAHKTPKDIPNTSTQKKIDTRQNNAAEKQLKGHVDGFKENITLHGWVDSTNFGDGQSKVVKHFWHFRGADRQ